MYLLAVSKSVHAQSSLYPVQQLGLAIPVVGLQAGGYTHTFTRENTFARRLAYTRNRIYHSQLVLSIKVEKCEYNVSFI